MALEPRTRDVKNESCDFPRVSFYQAFGMFLRKEYWKVKWRVKNILKNLGVKFCWMACTARNCIGVLFHFLSHPNQLLETLKSWIVCFFLLFVWIAIGIWDSWLSFWIVESIQLYTENVHCKTVKVFWCKNTHFCFLLWFLFWQKWTHVIYTGFSHF